MVVDGFSSGSYVGYCFFVGSALRTRLPGYWEWGPLRNGLAVVEILVGLVRVEARWLFQKHSVLMGILDAGEYIFLLVIFFSFLGFTGDEYCGDISSWFFQWEEDHCAWYHSRILRQQIVEEFLFISFLGLSSPTSVFLVCLLFAVFPVSRPQKGSVDFSHYNILSFFLIFVIYTRTFCRRYT